MAVGPNDINIFTNTPGNVPTADQMAKDGRIGIQQADGKLFTRRADGTVRTTDLEAIGGGPDLASLPLGNLTHVIGNDSAGALKRSAGVNPASLPTATLTYVMGHDSSGTLSRTLFTPALNLNSIALNDYYSLTSGGTNWSPALVAAFADMDTSAKYLTIHNGDFTCVSPVTRTSGNRFIIEGSARSSLNFTGSGSGITLNFTNQNQGPQISNIFIRSQYAGTAGTALSLIGPVLATHPYWATKLYDVRVAPQDPTVGTWGGGIYLENVWNPLIQNCELKGKGQSTNLMDMAFGIQLQNCQTVHIHKLYATHIGVVVKETGSTLSEGFTCTNSEMVGVATGIELKANLARLNGAISDNHINAYNFCVDASNVWSMSIHDNLLFKVNDFNTNWIGVRLISCKHNKVHNNHFRPSAGVGAATGIVFNNTNFCKAHFNTFDSWGSQTGIGITLFGASSYNEIMFNSRMSDISAPSLVYQNGGSGSNNRYVGNAPDNGTGSFDQFVPAGG